MLLVLSLLFALEPSAHADFVPGANPRQLNHDGQDRTFSVYAPLSYDGSQPVPLVVDLHGAGSNGTQQLGISGMNQRSEVEGFLVVYPDGLFETWNAGVCCGEAVTQNVDDVGFIRAMVGSIQAEGNLDASRLYVTGLSNGGAMSQRLACEAADLFAAAAPLAFPTPYVDFATECQPIVEIPVLLFMGLTDIVVPYENGAFGGAVESLDSWRQKNSCGPEPMEIHTVRGGSFCDVDLSCGGNTQVGLCSVAGSSFDPPLDQFNGHILYVNDDGLTLASMIWSFFETGDPIPAPPPVPAIGPLGRLFATLLLAAAGLSRLSWRRTVFAAGVREEPVS